MSRGKTRCTHDVNVVLYCLPCDLFRGRKHGREVYVEPYIRKRCCNDFCSSVVTVLAHLGNEHPGPASMQIDKAFNIHRYRLPIRVILVGRTIDT